MTLHVIRFLFEEDTTLGMLLVNKRFFCWTTEDRVRDVKIKNETAIPTGIYRVELTDKNKWGKLMPHVLDVPNFQGIYFHAGNDKDDSSGCILLGDKLASPTRNEGSRFAFDRFMGELRGAGGEDIILSVENYVPKL